MENLSIDNCIHKLLSDKKFVDYMYHLSLDGIPLEFTGTISPSMMERLILCSRFNRKLQFLMVDLLDYISADCINERNFSLLLHYPGRMRNTFLSAIAHQELAFSQMLVLNRHPLSLEAFSFLFDHVCHYTCFNLEDMKTIIRENKDVTVQGIRDCITFVKEKYGANDKVLFVERLIDGASDDMLISICYSTSHLGEVLL